MRLVVLARHAQSELNAERRVNGDPSRPVALTDGGKAEARLLGVQLANLPIEVCFHTRFGRTRETAELALAGRTVPFEVEPLFDDIDVGDLEGVSLDEYRAYKHAHSSRAEPFPSGESLDDAARRYAAGLRRLAEGSWGVALVVCHEIPIRYTLNACMGSGDLDAPHDVPNATPFLFDVGSLAGAAAAIEQLSR